MSTEQPVALLENAYKTFKKPVLQDVSLHLEAGTILGLIGPSGAGKTTTIKSLMGMEKLDQGQAALFGTPMPNRKILQRVGYMGQSDALYESLSAHENLVFFGSLMGLTGAQLYEGISKYSQLVDLADVLSQPVATFSGGMKRRLSLAITLLADPNLLILDEPTVGIDPSLRITIWRQLRTLATQGKGIIVTTHAMDEAEKCDVVGLIIAGKLFAWGSPAELKQKFQARTIEEVFLKAEVNAS
ncbi:ABC transporter, ATP-binding protein SagG family protein [Enterococcus canis]|uniref:ABC transporter, ATP-binding protein SagG family protein n=1 Tax=Enterococcus canis TaxID=214095 RepID=A0A1L8RFC0_9ENTE|nr:ABC transporter ATP-binding protein [Enterococcus canis]OJG18392.1 ABC transporter, ATP-binding protein SagG family protein [Enterococcus canis]